MHRQLTGRRDSLDRVCHIIRSRTSRAVFLMAGPGIGKSMLADAVTERLSADMTVLRIHGSSSLSSVPYGVLAPYTSGLSAEESVSPVAVLRSVWTYFQQLKSGKDAPMLLVVDDAHHLDESTASIVVDMISAGWASVLAAGRPRPGLPQSLNQLWYDGLAERIDLLPLDRDQAAEMMAHVLDGTVPMWTVQCLWSASGGNPLLLDCLLDDAIAGGVLVKRNGIWLLLGHLPADGARLAGVVSKDLLRRTSEEQDALKLIALAEPVNRSMIEEVCGAAVVRSLLDQQVITEHTGVPSELRLWHSLIGEAIRRHVSISRSLQLRQKLSNHPDAQPASPEGQLRWVEWSLECGLDVPDPELLRAASLALAMFSNTSTRNLASHISDPALLPHAQVVIGRALFNAGDYGEAARLLDACWLQLEAHPDAAHILMLRASAHLALGQSAELLREESRDQHSATAGNAVDGVAGIPWQDRIHALLDLAAAGDHAGIQQIIRELESETSGPSGAAAHTIALALLAQTLAASGCAEQGVTAAIAAAAELPGLQDGPYFFNEFVLVRLVMAYLGIGDWTSAERELAGYSAQQTQGATTFGGSIEVLRGLALLRQGRMERAYQILLPATEALRVNDPLQQFQLSAALGFYAAARLGDTDQAKRLEMDYEAARNAGGPGELLEAAYAAAASEYLDRDGKGLAELHALATTDGVVIRSATLLECLTLCSDLGDHSVMPLISTLAETVEGQRAAGWRSLAQAWESGDADFLMGTASELEESGLVNLAREAYAKAGALLETSGERRRARQAVALREKCDHELGERFRESPFIDAPAMVHLTRREQDIVELAVKGLTDKEIAQQLMVSVRTVEGHLYRSYVKLGVRRRDELSQVLPKP
ncbi:LuxR C-terminal-related transcriptional regulator [Micrococcaceae bacterium Sec5.7]